MKHTYAAFGNCPQPLLFYRGEYLYNSNSRTSAVDYIEDLNTDLCQVTYASLGYSCGRAPNFVSPEAMQWITRMQTLYDSRDSYYRKWKKAYGLSKRQEIRVTVRRLIKQYHQETLATFCEQMGI